MDCTSLTSVTIPEGITSIEYGAFNYCDNLKTSVIPKSVTEISEFAYGTVGGVNYWGSASAVKTCTTK